MRERAQAIIIRDRKVLFGYGKINNKYTHFFIGGGIEKGENPNEAIIREIEEETNVKGEIIFQFDKELKENEFTFLVDIGEKKCKLGFDPEEINVPDEEKNLQKIIWIPLSEKSKFTSIDIDYLKILVEECKKKNYYPKWLSNLKELCL